MKPFIRSLNAKLLLVVFGFVVLSGIIGAIRVGFGETQRIQALYDNRLQALSTRYNSYLESELDSRLQALQAARQVLQEDLAKDFSGSLNIANYRDVDGAYRLYSARSAVFVPPDTEVTDLLNHQVAASGKSWDYIAPVLTHAFSGLYFISTERVSRAWPSTIVSAHRPDHDVTQEIFFTTATPANNPEREARWTPIYFDVYSKVWMTSLVLPVYMDDVFVGVVGGDINVTYLLEKLDDLDADGNQIEAFIFNRQAELILHSKSSTHDDANAAYPALKTDSRQDQILAEYMHKVVNNDLLLGTIYRQKITGGQLNVVANRLTQMDWIISFYYPQSVIANAFQQSMLAVYANIMMLAVFLFVVLFFSIRRLVTYRIRALADATEKIDRDRWYLSVPEVGYDEIGRLGRSINNMLDQIRHLVRGLDDKIVLLDKAGAESRKLMSAIENSVSLVAILNKDWQLDYANTQYWQVTGYNLDEHCEKYQALLLSPQNTQQITIENIKTEILSGKPRVKGEDTGQWQAEYLAETGRGEQFWIIQTITAIMGDNQEPEFYVCVGQDISDLKAQQQEVEKLAYYDHLTGLANRTEFKRLLGRALQRGQRVGNKVALFYLDLDHFKRINDTFGHEAGDQLLTEVSRRLKRELRDDDVVARLGGDEFAVLLDQVESPQYAYVVANKIINTLNKPIELQGKEVVVGVSIGITMAPDDSNHIDNLMKNADLAMYQAKYKGRNAFQFYTSDMNLAVEQRLTVEREMRAALKSGQFELYYQPVVDLVTGKIVAAEALVRWNHPTRGLVLPGEFIPAAEDSGLIVPLGKWVLKTACYQAKLIQKSMQRKFSMSVNLSARQLNDTSFLDNLDRILEATSLPPESLVLEVTESTLMEDAENVIPRLEKLRLKGCSLAIDDFGTGYSSLSYLKRLPINSLKVDRSFVKDLPDDEEDRAITSLIVAMANSLRYRVVVEGVETDQQHRFLTECGCHFGQGYLYSRPLPADQLMALLFDDVTY
ncbi:EAL domain-containing protein [Gilvimarinus polysaccharolyticus]|uniref:EAL domain-containing protein n=1 Tax=Gilvimarinus polysaccharolyticus TaxID=863921 RepID=UPI0006734DDC|nr:EAL domain-containing protein [Gilvimarinus polysaccharolyticus]